MGEERFWVVRVPKGQKVIEAVKRQGVVAVGFSITQSLGNVKDRESMKDLYRSVCPDARERRVNAAIGQLHRDKGRRLDPNSRPRQKNCTIWSRKG